MLLTSKETIREAFPKQGTFFAVWQDVDTEPKVLCGTDARIPYIVQQYTWLGDKLFEEVVDEIDACNNAMHWERTTLEASVNFLHEEAHALGFFHVPENRKVF